MAGRKQGALTIVADIRRHFAHAIDELEKKKTPLYEIIMRELLGPMPHHMINALSKFIPKEIDITKSDPLDDYFENLTEEQIVRLIGHLEHTLKADGAIRKGSRAARPREVH